MDWQTLINVGGTIGLTVLGWYLNAQRAQAAAHELKYEGLKQELTNFRIEVAKDYVTTHDLADIRTTLIRIEAKLDSKADK